MNVFSYKLWSLIGIFLITNSTHALYQDIKQPKIDELYKSMNNLDKDLQVLIEAVYNAIHKETLNFENLNDESKKTIKQSGNKLDNETLHLLHIKSKLLYFIKKLIIKINDIENLDCIEKRTLLNIIDSYIQNNKNLALLKNINNRTINIILNSQLHSILRILNTINESFSPHIKDTSLIANLIDASFEIIECNEKSTMISISSEINDLFHNIERNVYKDFFSTY